MLTTLFLLASPAAQAQALFAERDTDEDGVRDRDDACVRIPEIRNNYLDGDGCPDVLSGITVGARFDGNLLLEEGSMLFAMANGETRNGSGMLEWEELVPGTQVTVAAVLGCHAAQSIIEVEPRHRKVRLQLEPALFGEVSFLVRDAFGDTPEQAKLVWAASEPAGCGLAEEVVLERGYGKVRVGRGKHTIKVTTPNGARTRVEIEVGEGTKDVFVDMPIPGGREANGGRLLAEMVYFADNSHELDGSGQAVVSSVATYLKAHPDLSRIIVEGHADKGGWGPYNEQLSERRARAVAEALVDAGVPADRLRIEGRGEKDPAETGYSNDALAKNRRVQFIVAK